MNKMTMKQLADELGVSKQTIHNRIYKSDLTPSLSNLIEKIDGTIYISEEGVSLIKSRYKKNKNKTNYQEKVNFDSNKNNVDSEKASNFDSKPSNFDSFNNFLIDQIKQKDKEIEKLHELLDHQQQLTAIAENRLKLIESGVSKENIEEETPKWKWWPFKKNKNKNDGGEANEK